MHGNISQIMNRAYRAAHYHGLGYSAFPETDYVTKEFKKTMLGSDSYSEVLQKARDINDPPKLEYEEFKMVFFEKLESEGYDYTEHKRSAERNGIEIKQTVGIQDFYDNTQRSRVKENITVYRFDDIQNGYHLDFTYESSSFGLNGEKRKGDVIHVMIIKCEPDRQGRVWELKKTLQRFKKHFLDEAGVSYCFGRVVPDNQYDVKEKPNGEQNWRKKERKLKNYNSGSDAMNSSWKLLNLYLRLGWVYPQLEHEDFPIIFLLSDEYKKEILKDEQLGKWLKEMLKFSRYEKQ